MTFTSRKLQLVVILTVQNPFQNSKFGITIRRMIGIHIIFQSYNEANVIVNISKMLFHDPFFLRNCMQRLIERNLHYTQNFIMVDCSPQCKLPNVLRTRAMIFEDHPWFFVKRKN